MYTDVDADLQIGGLQIVSGPAYSKASDFHRLWSWLRYFFGAAVLVLRTSPRALLFFVAQPPYLPLIGWLRHIILGQRYVVWVDDIYPDAIVRHHRLPEKHVIIRLWQGLNRLIFGRASKIFTLGPCMAEVLGQYLSKGSQGPSIVVVPTWVDSIGIQPVPKEENPFASEHGQVGKLTILYSGNLGLSHDLTTMVEAARRLQERNDIHFLIIGAGPQWSLLETAARELKNLTLLPHQPVETLPFSLTTGDVAVISLDKGLEGVSMPSKTQFMMAAGAALIGLGQPPNDIQMVIEEHGCGINVSPGDVDGFVAAVLRFREDHDFLLSCRHNARLAAETAFSRSQNVQKVLQEVTPFLSS